MVLAPIVRHRQTPMPDILSLNQLIAERVREHPDLQILAIPDKNFNVRLSQLSTAHTPAHPHPSTQNTLPLSSMQPPLSLQTISETPVPSLVAQMVTQRAGLPSACWA